MSHRTIEDAIRAANPDDLERAARRREKKDRLFELHRVNGQLIQKAKKAPLMAKAATIEQLADNQQEMQSLIIELL